jgi:hypothetical protein
MFGNFDDFINADYSWHIVRTCRVVCQDIIDTVFLVDKAQI